MADIVIPSLSVVYPMYNEAETVDELLDETIAFLMAHYPDYEIIAVDDASTDATGKILDRRASLNPRIKVIHHATNRKLGGSLKSGLAAAKKSLVLYSDADFPFDLQDIQRAVRAIRRADIVAAYRHDRHSEGWRRTFQSYIYNLLVTVLFRLHLRDVNFSFKLFRTEALKRVLPRSEGSFVDAEILIRGLRQGLRIVQIGVDYFPRTRGASTLTGIPVILTMFADMLRLFPELRKLKKMEPLKGDPRRSEGTSPQVDTPDHAGR